MANRSTFPDSIDTFIEHYDMNASDVVKVQRFQELKLKSNRTSLEDEELATLSSDLRNKIISPEDFNKFQDALVNMETFIKNNVEGYILGKQTEFTSYVDGKTSQLETFTNTQISDMEDSKNYFTTFVDAKEAEVRTLVREFDSNSARYYQRWTATEGQSEFNIYYGGDVSSIPTEAKLDISSENIDVIINGTTMTPNVDYRVKPDGLFDKIEFLGGTTISAGAEVIAKWYKNVGKLYFTHASTHGEDGSDPLIVTEGMLQDSLKSRLPLVSKNAPTSPVTNQIWIDIN